MTSISIMHAISTRARAEMDGEQSFCFSDWELFCCSSVNVSMVSDTSLLSILFSSAAKVAKYWKIIRGKLHMLISYPNCVSNDGRSYFLCDINCFVCDLQFAHFRNLSQTFNMFVHKSHILNEMIYLLFAQEQIRI